jgi:hypothetical protein
MNKWKKAKVVETNFGYLTIKKEGRDDTNFQLWEETEKIRKLKPNQLLEPEASVESESSGGSNDESSSHLHIQRR